MKNPKRCISYNCSHRDVCEYAKKLKFELRAMRDLKLSQLQEMMKKEEKAKDSYKNDELYKLLLTRIDCLNLSTRAINVLYSYDIENLGELVQYDKTTLLKFRQMGKKTLSELNDVLEKYGLEWGFDIAKFKRDLVAKYFDETSETL